MSKNKLAPSSDYFLRFDKKIVISTPSGKPYRVFASLVDKKGNLVAPIGINVDDLADFYSFVNVAKNTEPAPKYDPCRKFREGDKVRPVERYGRQPDDGAPVNVICEVVEDERKNGTVAILAREACGAVRFRVTALYLKLVTPVEELGPYSVRHNEAHAAWSIYGPYDLSAVNYFYGERYPYTQKTAKAAAEAERDRLNAEYRKEKEND